MINAYWKRWVFEDEAGEAGGGSAAASPAGGGEQDLDGAGGGEGGGAGAAADGGEKGAAAPDMKSAIDVALGYAKDGDGKAVAKEGEPKKPEPKKAEAIESETHHANGKPKKGANGEDLDADGKPVQKSPAKAKTAAELDLKPEERKLLGAKAQARFGEMITALKSHETTIATMKEQNQQLAAGRDAILGLMKENRVDQDALAGYLHFNGMITSGDRGQLEQALQILEGQRAALYKALGKEPEGGGIDLLKDHADLAQQVADEEITRKAALEIAHARNEKAARAAAEERSRRSTDQRAQQQQAHQKAAEAALSSIEKWTAEISKSDLDFKAKEDRLLAQLDEVINNYSPDKWLPTLKLLYSGIEITKAPATAGGGPKPLRPSGARPGNKAPNDMLAAINQGLGYAGAERD